MARKSRLTIVEQSPDVLVRCDMSTFSQNWNARIPTFRFVGYSQVTARPCKLISVDRVQADKRGMHMSKASVQQRFASAFMTLVPQTPTKRVTVAELTRYLHVDRKTFYNYFDNIDSLMIWIYRDYLAKMLEGALFDGWEKEKPSADAFDPYPELPFYARRREKDLLCQGPYFKAMAYHWENHRRYYSIVFSSSCYLDLFDYIIALFLPPFREDVRYYLDGRSMPDIVVDFIAEYHVMGVFGRLRYHFTQTNKFIMQDEIDSFWNYAHTAMKESVECCFETVERHGIARLLGQGGQTVRFRGYHRERFSECGDGRLS